MCLKVLNSLEKAFSVPKGAITHITDGVSVLLGQDNSREVDNTGELHSAWGLAVEPFIEDSLGISSFNHVHRVLR